MSVKVINSKDFNDEVNNDLVLIDFFAKWCGPCRMISPIVDELASSLGILSIPTLLLYKQGKLVSKKIGFQSKDELKSWIEENK